MSVASLAASDLAGVFGEGGGAEIDAVDWGTDRVDFCPSGKSNCSTRKPCGLKTLSNLLYSALLGWALDRGGLSNCRKAQLSQRTFTGEISGRNSTHEPNLETPLALKPTKKRHISNSAGKDRLGFGIY